MSSCSLSSASEAALPDGFAVSRPSIVLFGDSITQNSFAEDGFGARLAHRYSRRADVINRGLSGYTTRFARHAVPHLPLSTTTLLTVIFFGANDAVLADADSHHHVPLDEYEEHLVAMIHDVRMRTSGRIILVAPPPVHHAMRLEGRNYGTELRLLGVFSVVMRSQACMLNVCDQLEIAKASLSLIYGHRCDQGAVVLRAKIHTDISYQTGCILAGRGVLSWRTRCSAQSKMHFLI